MAAFGVSYEMPSLVISVRNASSVELTAPAVPAVATAASPREPAMSAVPANSVKRCEANIGLLVDVGLFRVVSGLTSGSDSCLGGFLEAVAASAASHQPCFSHHLCRSSMLGDRASASRRSEFLLHTRSGPLL